VIGEPIFFIKNYEDDHGRKAVGVYLEIVHGEWNYRKYGRYMYELILINE
jgi:hypothetical protein